MIKKYRGGNFLASVRRKMSSITAWLALNGDLVTLADGTRELVSSEGNNVLSTTGMELTFDGVADGIFTNIDPNPQELQSVRISWNNSPLATNGTLLGSGATATSMQGFLGLFLSSTGKVGASYRHRDSGGTLQYYTIYSVEDYEATGTAHATLDANSGEMCLYVNGVLSKSEVFTVIPETPVVPYGTYKFAVGASNVTTNPTYEFNGNLSNAQFIDGLMTPSQVLSDFNNPEQALNHKLNGLSRLYNTYLEDILAPTYNSGNPAHLLITSLNGNWTQANLNNPQYQHFFIEPSSTAYSLIELTLSGTAEAPRTLSLHNSDHLHPATMADAQQANIDLLFTACSYWQFNRISTIDNTNDFMLLHNNNSTNNIFHRCHFKNFYNGIKIRNGGHNNVVQLSYFNGMTHSGRIADKVGWALATNGEEGVSTTNCKFIANDMRNMGDAVQLIRSSSVATGSYDGTIIDSNNIWLDGDVYTNGDYATNGYDANGNYQVAEEALDFKIGSDDALNPIIVTNNVVHGYRKCDETVGGSLSTGAGGFCVVHFGVKNLNIENNIVYDCPFAVAFSGLDTGLVQFDYSGKDCRVRYNIFANIGTNNPTDEAWTKNACRVTEGINFDENIFYNMPRNTLDGGHFMYFENPSGTNTFDKNIVIDCHGSSDWWAHDDSTLNDGVSLVSFIDNYYYASTSNLPFRDEDEVDGGNHNYTTVAEANMLATSFDTQALALSSSFSLVGTASTETSPHIIGGHTLRDLSQDTQALILAIPMTRGELEPRMFKDGVVSDLVPEVSMATNWVSGQSEGLQKIYFNDDMTKADTMHISTDYNQIIAVVPTEDYTVKWTTSNNATYELSTFTTNIDTNQMLAHMGVSDAEIKSIEGV